MTLRNTALTFGALIALSAGAAAAQTPPPPPHAGHPGQHQMRMKAPDPEARAQRLRDTLQLRPDQEGALKAFIAATTPQPRGERPPMEGKDKLTTPQRLDRMAERMNERQTRFQKHAAAVKTFYAALTPAQQKAFDALHHGMGKHRMMRKGGGMMMMRHAG